MVDQHVLLQLLWFALYFLVGMGVLAARMAAKGTPEAWSPLGLLRRMQREADSDRNTSEALNSYPAALALGIAFLWVVTVVAWPLLLVWWAWKRITRSAAAGGEGRG